MGIRSGTRPRCPPSDRSAILDTTISATETSAAHTTPSTAKAAPAAVDAPTVDLSDTALYIHRELSQLQFNIRVLEQALDETKPLMERLKFLLIFSSNMDEFFEIRVAGLKQQIAFDHELIGADGIEPKRALAEIAEIAHRQIERQYAILNERILPELAEQGIRIVRRNQWSHRQKLWVRRYFRQEVAPLVTPIGLDPTHPFPRLVNKSLNFIVASMPSAATRAWPSCRRRACCRESCVCPMSCAKAARTMCCCPRSSMRMRTTCFPA